MSCLLLKRTLAISCTASDSPQRMKTLFLSADTDHVCIDPSSEPAGLTDQNWAFWILIVGSKCVAPEVVTGFEKDDSGQTCTYQPVALYLYATPPEQGEPGSAERPASSSDSPGLVQDLSHEAKPGGGGGPSPDGTDRAHT